MKVKEESEKVGLKLNIQKTKIMASSPITSNRWGNNGNSERLYFGGSKITADGNCSHEIKRHLLLGRKAMTNLDSILKSRDITLSTKVHLVTEMVFPVVMYRYESLTIKKAEHRRIKKKTNIYFCFIDYMKAFDCVDHNKLWKFLKEIGIPDHLTCLLRNLYVGQEANS